MRPPERLVRQKLQRRPMWIVLLKKQLSLPPTEESIRQTTQQQKQQRAEERRLPLNLHKKLEPWRPTRTTSQSDHPDFRGQ